MKLKLEFKDYIFFSILLIIISFFVCKSLLFTDSFTSIAKVYETNVIMHPMRYIDYKYYVDGKPYKDTKRIKSGESSKYIGKYFEVEISNKNFSSSKLNLDKQITNKKKIEKSGF